MSPLHGRPKAGELPLGGKARSAKELIFSPLHGRPKAGEPLGGKEQSSRVCP